MIFRLFAFAALAVLLTGCDLEYRYLYYPSSSLPSAESLKGADLRPWQSTASDYRGLVAAGEATYACGTVVVFHGNGGVAADRVFYAKVLGPLGYRVILAEYPRYGGRKGKLGEKAFVEDASETVALAYEKYGGPLFILGESLGCGIAAAAAGRTSARIDGVILITPWDTLASVARSKFPFLPVGLILKDKYDNVENLRSFKGRIAVVGAERDHVIPVNHAERLFKSLPASGKRMWIVKGAGHNDWPMFVDTAWWRQVMSFIAGGKE